LNWSFELEMPGRDVAAFNDLRLHDVLVYARAAFLRTRRKNEAKRQGRHYRMKELLIRQVSRGNLAG
jgi:hypothetical protein